MSPGNTAWPSCSKMIKKKKTMSEPPVKCVVSALAWEWKSSGRALCPSMGWVRLEDTFQSSFVLAQSLDCQPWETAWGTCMWFTEAGELLGPDDRMCQGWGCNELHVYLGTKGLLCLCPDSASSHPLAPRLLSSLSDHSVMLTFLINMLSRFSDPQQQDCLLGPPCISMP